MIIMTIIEQAILAYFLFVNGVYLVLLIMAAGQLWIDRQVNWMQYRLWRSPRSFIPRISVVAPAHNEARTIVESVSALLALWYANLEIVVVDDGSTDDTLAALIDAFGLVPVPIVYEPVLVTKPVRAMYRSVQYPHLIVLRKDGGGKADALNAGVNVATGELVCSIDADTLIEADALQRMVRPFLLYEGVLAAGGTIRPVNGCTIVSHRVERVVCPGAWLAGVQVVEYLRAFLFGRLGWNWLGGNLIISGAFGLFRREAVLEVGGYLRDTVGEDMELIVRLRRSCREHGRPDRVVFIPDPVAWTEVPSTLGTLARQRERWHRGLADVLWTHRRLCGNPRYGLLGLVVVPCFVVVELLAPVVETLGLVLATLEYLLDELNVSYAVTFLLVAYGFGILLSLASLVLEEWTFARFASGFDRLRFILWAVIEYAGYHQLTVWFRLRGLARFLQGRKDWGDMTRQGFSSHRIGPATVANPTLVETASSTEHA